MKSSMGAALIAASGAMAMRVAAAAVEGETRRQAKPLLDSKPMPPVTMTRQQRRAADREALKDPRRWQRNRNRDRQA